jgi:hypothetical protein
MVEIEQLRAQAHRCRRLALGLTNRDDIRTLEMLACELEDRVRRSSAREGKLGQRT